MGRIDSRSDVLSGGSPRVFTQSGRVLWDGDRVKVDDTEHGVVGGLHVAPLHQGTCVVAEVE